MLTQEKVSSINEKLNEFCEKNNVPGMAFAITSSGKPIYEKFYGYRDVDHKLPVNADTIFGVASITKSFAALAIMQLEDAGRLSVEDSVTKWLPEFKLPNKTYQKNVQIHHLLTHSSGLPGMGAVNLARAESIRKDPDGEVLRPALFAEDDTLAIKTVIELMNEMAETKYELLGAPGTAFNYSNEGYALLQGIIERASGQPFLDYMEENVLTPLNMNRSLFRTEDLDHFDNVTELYAYDKEGKVFHSPAWWDVGDIYTNGSLKTSITDLLKYAEVYCQHGTVNGTKILSEESVDKMVTPHITMPTEDTYGYGLQVDYFDGIKLFGHGGGIKGVSSHFKVVPSKDLAIAVIVNLAEVPVATITDIILREILDVSTEGPIKPTYVMDEESLQAYVGDYQSKEGQQVQTVISDGLLNLQIGKKQIPLHPYSENGFYTTEGQKIVFLITESGDLSGLFRGKRFIPKV